MQHTITLTSEMAHSYPDLYRVVDETPLYLAFRNNDDLHGSDFEKHNETLEEQMFSRNGELNE